MMKTNKELNMLVQIAIDGDYMENYGAHEWDGEGHCPQHWKCKSCSPLPIVSNVSPKDIPMVMIDVVEAMDAFSYNNEVAHLVYRFPRLYPNKLAENDFIYFDYRDYDCIKSIPKHEIDAFLAVKKKLYALVNADPFEAQVTIPEPLPYEEYDIV